MEKVVVANRNDIPIPIPIRDLGTVHFGAPKRLGAITIEGGEGECVGRIAMMLKGANANVVTSELEKRVDKLQKFLPGGLCRQVGNFRLRSPDQIGGRQFDL